MRGVCKKTGRMRINDFSALSGRTKHRRLVYEIFALSVHIAWEMCTVVLRAFVIDSWKGNMIFLLVVLIWRTIRIFGIIVLFPRLELENRKNFDRCFSEV